MFLLSHLAVASGEINSRLYRVCQQMMSGNTQVMLTNYLRSRGVFGLLSRFAFARFTIILVCCGRAFLESLDFVNVRKHVSVRLILHECFTPDWILLCIASRSFDGNTAELVKAHSSRTSFSVRLDGTQLHLEPGQAVIPHGPDREFTVAEALPRGKRA